MRHDGKTRRRRAPPPMVPTSVLGWIAPIATGIAAMLVLAITGLFAPHGARADGR